MGMWHISIRGVGIHHNKNTPADANKLAAGFVKLLENQGHSIIDASFTHGGADNLRDSLGDEVTPLTLRVGDGVSAAVAAGIGDAQT